MSKEMLAIEFGSSNTCIYKSGSGVVLYEPTVATIDEDNLGVIKSFGEEAKKLIGKTAKSTKIIFPVFEGEIVNEKVAASLLLNFLKKCEIKTGLIGPTVLFAVPCGSTNEMIEKYKNVCKRVGINKTYFVESAFLSAIGQRIPFNESAPCFVIDMAGGVTNIAVLSLDGIIAGLSVNFGANKITTDLIDYIAEKFSVQIGLLTAERLRKEIGSLDENDSLCININGQDINSKRPISLSIKACDIFQPIKIYYDKIAEISLKLLRKLPPEVSAEISHSGLHIAGEASKTYNLLNYYKNIFKMNIQIAENPSTVVALGGGIVLSNKVLLKKIELKNN